MPVLMMLFILSVKHIIEKSILYFDKPAPKVLEICNSVVQSLTSIFLLCLFIIFVFCGTLLENLKRGDYPSNLFLQQTLKS